jgi:hypothetical protein
MGLLAALAQQQGSEKKEKKNRQKICILRRK